MSPAAPAADASAGLQRLFGYAEFRPGQRDAVDAVLAGRDVLAVMPTGSGKSLCYQLPALISDGVTLVVSPLIALMEDQYAALRNRGLEGVEMLSSSMGPGAVDAALRRIGAGEARLVYVAPERFSSRRFLDAIGAAGVARLAVDEAHCLSEWGHDFRPDYLRLADVRERLGSPPTIALTATATSRVSKDIVSALRLRDPVMLRTGFDRRNLAFAVVPVAGDHGKPVMLMRLLQAPGALPAVVYCGRRRTCEEVTEALVAGGIRTAAYHAGLTGERRSATLDAFLSGELEAVAATTAFGMGIDKPDVRSVVHWALPASPEEYYQQAGRAGRDGDPARCTLLYSPRDKGLIVFFINRAKLDAGDLTGVHRRLAESADPGGVFRVAERDVPAEEPRAAVAPHRRPEAVARPPGRRAGRGQAGRASALGPPEGDRRVRDVRPLPARGAAGLLRRPARPALAGAVLRPPRLDAGCGRGHLAGGAADRPYPAAGRRGRRRRRPAGSRRDRRLRRADAALPDPARLGGQGAARRRARRAGVVRRPRRHDRRGRARPHRPPDRGRHAREDRRVLPARPPACRRAEEGGCDRSRRGAAGPDRRSGAPPRPRGRAVPAPRAGGCGA
jgi:RecQ family ATP-dependent DNA helicase